MMHLSQMYDENGLTRTCLTTVLYISACLFLVGLGKREVWAADEFGVVETATAIASSDGLIASCPNGRSWLERPPLFYWIVATIFRYGGENTLWARLPAALAAISAATLLFVLARYQGYSNLQAVATGLVLATSYAYFGSGRQCCPDAVVCLFTVGALLSFWQTCRSNSGRAGWHGAFVLCLSAACFTGGYLGPLVVVVSLAFWLLLQRPFRLSGLVLLVSGSTLALVPVGIWMWFVSRHLTGYAPHRFSWLMIAWRLVWNHPPHDGTSLHYLGQILIGSLPWSLLLPWAVAHHVRRLRTRASDGSALLALVWLIVSFIIQLVLTDGTRSHLLLGYPAAALLVGTSLVEALEKESDDSWFRLSSRTLAFLMIVVPICLGGAYWYREKSMLGMGMLMPALCLGLWSYGKAATQQWTHFYGIAVANIMLLLLSYDWLISMQLNRRPL